MKVSKQRQVLELRAEGYGYKSIAAITGETRDAVRGLCRRRGLQGYLGYGRSHPSQPADEQTAERPQRHCDYCGREIVPDSLLGRPPRFCRDACRRRWWVENPDKKDRRPPAWYSFVCLYCGVDFRAYGNRHRKYCSVRCAHEHRHAHYTETTGYELGRRKDGSDIVGPDSS